MKLILMGGGKYAGLIYHIYSKIHVFVGFIDDISSDAYVSKNYGLKYLGTSDELDEIKSLCDNVIIAIGSEGDLYPRRKYYEKFSDAGFNFPVLINPSLYLADNSVIGEGTVFQIDAIVNPMARIGKNCIICSKAVIGHDVQIGDNVYIAPGVIINGSVVIGNDVFIGTGAVIIQKKNVGSGCVIAACACVISDIPNDTKVAGVPAKILG
jgi:sugar O-acyltransferase (sialic acid O-acetyltransferase NeuD family)